MTRTALLTRLARIQVMRRDRARIASSRAAKKVAEAEAASARSGFALESRRRSAAESAARQFHNFEDHGSIAAFLDALQRDQVEAALAIAEAEAKRDTCRTALTQSLARSRKAAKGRRKAETLADHVSILAADARRAARRRRAARLENAP